MRFGGRWSRAAVAAAAAVVCLVTASSAGAVAAGAAFTTFDETLQGCLNSSNGINCNQYTDKDKVYMSGGPSAAGLSDGDYYFAVLVPGSQNGGAAEGADGNLSDQTAGATVGDLGSGDSIADRTFSVSGHEITSGYTGPHAIGSQPNSGRKIIGLAPFDDTSNEGGVYILAVCEVGFSDPAHCKYDAFRINGGEVQDFGEISGLKYYDTNRNGQHDAGEPGLPDWAIDWTDTVSGQELTDATGAFTVTDLVEDTYTFTEVQGPLGWVQTGNTVDQSTASAGSTVTLANMVYEVDLADGGVVGDLNFGNVCEIANSNGFTLGYWSNQNGRAVLLANDPAWRALLNGASLRNANGTLFTIGAAAFGTSQNNGVYGTFRNWLLNATATNMSYMLSAQLAATMLDRAYKSLNGTDLVLDPNGNWVTINQAITDAIAFLQANGNTTAAGPLRTKAEAYKNIFDRLNNNTQTITPADPARCPAYDFTP